MRIGSEVEPIGGEVIGEGVKRVEVDEENEEDEEEVE